MFCPLCKAEYRDGFTTCSDCRISLVRTQEEAKAVGVRRLWTGSNRSDFEAILTSLSQLDIPNKTKETLTTRPGPWLSLLFWRFMPLKSSAEYRVDVLEKDAERAAQAIPPVLKWDD